MKPTLYISTIVAALALLSGCSDDFTPTSLDFEREPVILAELEVGALPVISVSSTFSNPEEEFFPTGDDLPSGTGTRPNLSNLAPGGVKNKEMRFQRSFGDLSNIWVTESFRITEGSSYSLEADFSPVGMSTIFATTTAPVSGRVESLPEEVTLGQQDSYTFSLQLSDLDLEDNYYHVIPYLGNTSQALSRAAFTIDHQGTSDIFELSHVDGILIDINDSDNERRFDFSINASELSSNPSYIYLRVKTVAQEYYDFHRSLTLQAESSVGTFDAPVIAEGNILRGQGIFTAFTYRIDSIRVR